MKVMVTGSRSLTDSPFRAEVKAAFWQTLKHLCVDELIHGGAAGPDSWAAQWAIEEAGLPQHLIHNVRPKRGRGLSPAQELFLRNITMLGMHPDIVVVCWDGKSHGTEHAYINAALMNTPLLLIPVDLIIN